MSKAQPENKESYQRLSLTHSIPCLRALREMIENLDYQETQLLTLLRILLVVYGTDFYRNYVVAQLWTSFSAETDHSTARWHGQSPLDLQRNHHPHLRPCGSHDTITNTARSSVLGSWSLATIATDHRPHTSRAAGGPTPQPPVHPKAISDIFAGLRGPIEIENLKKPQQETSSHDVSDHKSRCILLRKQALKAKTLTTIDSTHDRARDLLFVIAIGSYVEDEMISRRSAERPTLGAQDLNEASTRWFSNRFDVLARKLGYFVFDDMTTLFKTCYAYNSTNQDETHRRLFHFQDCTALHLVSSLEEA
ncbi:uncharacterized protein Z518_04481 [Rhinocladiella mackenziei CBS 650.93]|uniref:Rhinocladiella mackenziei CBS 650.93 unplaced genomic scaffold supercont1.3, whole genome shotgun sequence n=1 Tax=Rhinocladiella mackenziei CBS 650.93 TaxID=1442369 RepID=A0A0D2JBQ1_9EURO|nr:uncharacterized protein Z518_04481 [Rhinocladiella mackenziei CBS 650.93]KIX06505.1 hypothetical protein Z518_04481 [Rhinocladiella mackenziei CBS 650.93]